MVLENGVFVHLVGTFTLSQPPTLKLILWKPTNCWAGDIFNVRFCPRNIGFLTSDATWTAAMTG